jgi:S-adenosylmethionine decarboxylase
MSYWGYHLILDCSGCNKNISNADVIYDFVDELVNAIDMKAVGEPIIEMLLKGEDNQGYSLMQLIETSNICGHFVDKDKSAYIDVFSCKEFDTNTVKDVIEKFFNPSIMKDTFLKRQA